MNELIINAAQEEAHIALLEDRQLVELHTQRKDNSYAVGDIYLGRIKKIVPGLNAAFVDIGSEKDAFLHYLDLGPQVRSLIKFTKATQSGQQQTSQLHAFHLESEIEKSGRMNQVFNNNQWIMVQVVKEPISTKGPRISSEISLAGRYVVMVPFTNEVAISQKIKSAEERNRLKTLVQSIRPKNFGVIIRTVAEGKMVADLDRDIQDLLSKWNSCWTQLKTARPPHRLLGEMSRTSTILRDILNANFNHIHVNEPGMFEEVKSFVRNISPGQEEIVKLYKGKAPIFEHFGVEKQIKSLFGKTVSMPSGAYLIVEHTEALHVIDVNSGNRSNPESSQDANALQVNLEAAKEVARQLRLRDMGGIIVVDFIDMHNTLFRKQLFDCVRNEMKKDRAKHNILPPSKFGLVQITRQRVRPETNIVTVEKCPCCAGSGEVKASVLLIDEIENNIKYCVKEQNEKTLTINVHPFIEAYLTKGWFSSVRRKWMSKYKCKLNIQPESSLHFLEYRFLNKAGEEIKL